MATLMDLIAGYSQGGAPVDDSSQSLGQAAKDLYQGLINPKAWQEVKQATQRTTNIAPAVLESLARGSVAQYPGIVGDASELLRKLSPQTMQQIFGNRVAPTTEEILGYVPRATSAYQGSQEHEMVGGLLSPAMGYFAKALPLATKDMPIGNMIAYHGTPHEIKGGFDISKVGTGEGAQSYGHGMYFAENPAVATEYRKALSGRTDLGEQPSDAAFIHAVESFREHGTPLDQIPEEMKKAYKTISDKDIKLAIQATEKGNLYKVDIPDKDIPNILDWDKPINQQSDAIKKALGLSEDKFAYFKIPATGTNYAFAPNMTGNELYKELTNLSKTQAKASELLNSLGIKGMRYLDEGSRDWRILHPDEAVSGKWTVGKWPGGGKETKYFDTEQEAKDYFNQNQTRNFVVFDPKQVKILEKNNQKIGE